MPIKKRKTTKETTEELEPQTWYGGASLVIRLTLALVFLSLGGLITLGLLLASQNPLGGLLCCGILFLPILLVFGKYEKLTLRLGKKNQPVAVVQKYRAFVPHEKSTHQLDKYYVAAVDNALERKRETESGSVLLFILSGFNFLHLLARDTGTATGAWILALKHDKASRGEEIFRSLNLKKVKAVAAAITPYLGKNPSEF